MTLFLFGQFCISWFQFFFLDFCFTSMVTLHKHIHCLDPKHHRVALCHFHKQNPVAGIDCCSAYSYGPAGLCKCLLTQGAFLICQVRPKAELPQTKSQAHLEVEKKFGFWCRSQCVVWLIARLSKWQMLLDRCRQHSLLWQLLNAFWGFMFHFNRSKRNNLKTEPEPCLDSYSGFHIIIS